MSWFKRKKSNESQTPSATALPQRGFAVPSVQERNSASRDTLESNSLSKTGAETTGGEVTPHDTRSEGVENTGKPEGLTKAAPKRVGGIPAPPVFVVPPVMPKREGADEPLPRKAKRGIIPILGSRQGQPSRRTPLDLVNQAEDMSLLGLDDLPKVTSTKKTTLGSAIEASLPNGSLSEVYEVRVSFVSGRAVTFVSSVDGIILAVLDPENPVTDKSVAVWYWLQTGDMTDPAIDADQPKPLGVLEALSLGQQSVHTMWSNAIVNAYINYRNEEIDEVSASLVADVSRANVAYGVGHLPRAINLESLAAKESNARKSRMMDLIMNPDNASKTTFQVADEELTEKVLAGDDSAPERILVVVNGDGQISIQETLNMSLGFAHSIILEEFCLLVDDGEIVLNEPDEDSELPVLLIESKSDDSGELDEEEDAVSSVETSARFDSSELSELMIPRAEVPEEQEPEPAFAVVEPVVLDGDIDSTIGDEEIEAVLSEMEDRGELDESRDVYEQAFVKALNIASSSGGFDGLKKAKTERLSAAMEAMTGGRSLKQLVKAVVKKDEKVDQAAIDLAKEVDQMESVLLSELVGLRATRREYERINDAYRQFREEGARGEQSGEANTFQTDGLAVLDRLMVDESRVANMAGDRMEALNMLREEMAGSSALESQEALLAIDTRRGMSFLEGGVTVASLREVRTIDNVSKANEKIAAVDVLSFSSQRADYPLPQLGDFSEVDEILSKY